MTWFSMDKVDRVKMVYHCTRQVVKLRTYVHLMPNSYERARLAVDAMFKPRRQAAVIDPSAG